MSTRRFLVLFGQPGEGSFNEAALRAAESLHQDGLPLTPRWIASPDPLARAAGLEQLARERPDLIVVHGGQGDEPVRTVAPEHPDIAFAISQGSITSCNVASYEVLQEHSAFLAGVLAGLHAGPEATGHLSGEKVRPGLKGRAAFVDGVRQATGSDATVHTLFCGTQHDPNVAAHATDTLAAHGARVIFVMLDRGRSGVIDRCRQHGIWQIGNVLDWVERDPEVFLASALADSGWCIRQAVHDHHTGNLPLDQITRRGLESPDIVSLRTGAAVAPDTRAVLESWRQRLLDGTYDPARSYQGAEVAWPPTAPH